MKIKLPDDLLIIDIVVVLLILCITFIPNTAARIVLGLPFLLFFPGYVLVETLFVRKAGSSNGMDGIERIALSFGMSIAITALIGLGLNYTPWGIRLVPILYAVSAFIVILSIIAIFRRRARGRKNLISETSLKLPGIWQGSSLNKSLNIILIAAILGAVSTLIYTVAVPKVGEKFTEFYILGINGQAADYPTDFVLNGAGSVKSVQYGSTALPVTGTFGSITLGIVNHEQQDTSYTVTMQADGTAVSIPFQGSTVNTIGPITLTPEGKWEQQIGIVPQHTGNNQEVEILLYKDGGTTAYLTLHLWINVSQ